MLEKTSSRAKEMLTALEKTTPRGWSIRKTNYGEARSSLLFLWGLTAKTQWTVHQKQQARGGHTVCLDIGYFQRDKPDCMTRLSVDHGHPWRLFDKTPEDPQRFLATGTQLWDGYDPAGPIVVAGLGDKSRKDAANWELLKIEALKKEFPRKAIIFRPKPKSKIQVSPAGISIRRDPDIREVIRGASLIVCRHSNVAIDGVLAGVPFRCDDGAAFWLQQREYTLENRLRFLHKLCHWQWRPSEAAQAWQFLIKVLET